MDRNLDRRAAQRPGRVTGEPRPAPAQLVRRPEVMRVRRRRRRVVRHSQHLHTPGPDRQRLCRRAQGCDA